MEGAGQSGEEVREKPNQGRQSTPALGKKGQTRGGRKGQEGPGGPGDGGQATSGAVGWGGLAQKQPPLPLRCLCVSPLGPEAQVPGRLCGITRRKARVCAGHRRDRTAVALLPRDERDLACVPHPFKSHFLLGACLDHLLSLQFWV